MEEGKGEEREIGREIGGLVIGKFILFGRVRESFIKDVIGR